MPPKSPVKSAKGSDSGMDQENAFLAMCLRNIDPDSKKVDMGAVADALGYGNVKSAGNRFSALKKKYDIRIETTYARSDGPGSPISPKPSPNKVQKPGAKRGRKPKAQTAAKEAQAKDEPEAKEEHDEDDHKAEVDKTSENEA
ncbi:uncharacterized protein N7458_011131 [Penicillium daleae]|uniref:Myb-like DNA-binding domain-containing protein n=1 Tax=Penicillium daleae TaxID=63821 RepID=A0AAD6C003_9EURO|nr:uncharacterized protein N7458_011131 [Penicillium daleae]KAJ5440133.1 hypothetical protein N7458_011131 [Penicillium daleae]